jgi:hypothetical protein
MFVCRDGQPADAFLHIYPALHPPIAVDGRYSACAFLATSFPIVIERLHCPYRLLGVWKRGVWTLWRDGSAGHVSPSLRATYFIWLVAIFLSQRWDDIRRAKSRAAAEREAQNLQARHILRTGEDKSGGPRRRCMYSMMAGGAD